MPSTSNILDNFEQFANFHEPLYSSITEILAQKMKSTIYFGIRTRDLNNVQDQTNKIRPFLLG